MESNWVHSALRPIIGLLFQPRVIMMMEKMVKWLAGQTDVLGENLPQCRLPTTNRTFGPDANPGRRGGKPATDRLSRHSHCVIGLHWHYNSDIGEGVHQDEVHEITDEYLWDLLCT
jgi:hypothetical protein